MEQVDFDDVSGTTPTQEFAVVQSREVGEYAVKLLFLLSSFLPFRPTKFIRSFRPAKFSNLSSITIFFPSSQGADSTRVYYIGFLGSFSHRTKEAPANILYEAQANPADHPNILQNETFGSSLEGGDAF